MIEKLKYDGENFGVVKRTDTWVIGMGNFGSSLGRLSKFERHLETDESFVLICGKARLFEKHELGVEEILMEPGYVYNVPKGTWHHCIVEKDAHVLIIENNGTCPDNSEVIFFPKDEE